MKDYEHDVLEAAEALIDAVRLMLGEESPNDRIAVEKMREYIALRQAVEARGKALRGVA